MSHLSEYEKKRLENIAKNKQILKELDVPTLKAPAQPTSKRSTSSSRRAARKPPLPATTRTSTRIRNKALGIANDDLGYNYALATLLPKVPKSSRVRSALPSLPFATLYTDEQLTELITQQTAFTPPGITKAFKPNSLKNSQLTVHDSSSVVKVARERIYSMEMYPCVDKVIISAGTKAGALAIWDATCFVGGSEREEIVHSMGTEKSRAECNSQNADMLLHPQAHPKSSMNWHYQPHAGAITNQQYNPLDTNLWTCSYDGAISRMDMAKQSFSPFLTHSGSFITAFQLVPEMNLLWYSDDLGILRKSDIRCKPDPNRDDGDRLQIHEKKVGALSISRSNPNCLATGSNDRSIKHWDVRNMSEPISLRSFARAVTSIQHHPLNHRYLVSTCYDDHVSLHVPSQEISGEEEIIRIPHNMQTGRWITLFKAKWDPKSSLDASRILIGNMQRALTTIDLDRSIHGDGPGVTGLSDLQIRDWESEFLSAQPAVNVGHSHLNVVASGTASGRCYLWQSVDGDEDNQ